MFCLVLNEVVFHANMTDMTCILWFVNQINETILKFTDRWRWSYCEFESIQIWNDVSFVMQEFSVLGIIVQYTKTSLFEANLKQLQRKLLIFNLPWNAKISLDVIRLNFTNGKMLLLCSLCGSDVLLELSARLVALRLRTMFNTKFNKEFGKN